MMIEAVVALPGSPNLKNGLASGVVVGFNQNLNPHLSAMCLPLLLIIEAAADLVKLPPRLNLCKESSKKGCITVQTNRIY
jgi:hypothetical protein